jgi:hypothetical protein
VKSTGICSRLKRSTTRPSLEGWREHYLRTLRHGTTDIVNSNLRPNSYVYLLTTTGY